MGAITRAAANNFTTGGVILPAGINDASVASVSSLAQVSASDGITFISSQTASSSSQVQFTSGIDSTYRTYLFKFINVRPNTDNNIFRFNLSTDAGSNWNVTKTDTLFYTYNIESGTSNALSYDAAEDTSQFSGFITIKNALSSDAGDGLNGYFYLFQPSSTTYVKHFLCTVSANHYGDYAITSYVGGYGNTTNAIDGIAFNMNTGTFNGTIQMYGIA